MCQACKLNLGAQLTEECSIGVTLKTHHVIHPKTNNKEVKHFATKIKKRDGCRIKLSFGLGKGMKTSTTGIVYTYKNQNKYTLSVFHYVIISGSS